MSKYATYNNNNKITTLYMHDRKMKREQSRCHYHMPEKRENKSPSETQNHVQRKEIELMF